MELNKFQKGEPKKVLVRPDNPSLGANIFLCDDPFLM